mmetsp:Transcript_7616/g.23341  ORF Transcript_7616/g.23341 Transcript_7616/m.23341 type:complete len:293 (-) Transcript_7616:24-902(-)
MATVAATPTPSTPAPAPAAPRVRYVNKQRVLVVCSRGTSARHRHLLQDLKRLLPHHKADSKLDTKNDPRALNEVCELKSCNGCVYLEARKRTDLYMWVARTPTGPSAKFLVQNVHTMDELKLTGNCGHGTRALLCFDATFDAAPHWRAIKDLLAVTFGTPRGHPKSKPFFDRAMCFAVDDGKVWVRHYQIVDDAVDAADALKQDGTSLVEIGPRLVLAPIRIFSGSFGGATLYHDAALVLPNEERAMARRDVGSKYERRKESQEQRREHISANPIPEDELADTFRDDGGDDV